PAPEYTWQVVIPGEQLASDLGYHLFGLTPYPSQDQNDVSYIYEDKGLGDGFYVEVMKKGGRKGAESQFRLAVFNNIDEESGICNIPWPDGLGDRKIGFQGLNATLLNYAPTAAEEYPCFFPSLTGPPPPPNPYTLYPTYPPYPCGDPAYGYGYAPDCMAAFLNGLHPYCDPDPLCGHPGCSYEYVEIRITVNCNFEDIGPGTPAYPSGDVQIKVVNTFELQTGCEYPHNISSHLLEQDFYVGAITIVKLDDADVDAWEITVDADITFLEIYKGTWRNRWEYKIPYWAKIPLKFKTTWIRTEVTD
ncbi:hypothetical protein KA005_27530, partial [bacterium]|nr:hypothetical protein [bacterium]